MHKAIFCVAEGFAVQKGTIYEASGKFYIRYRATEVVGGLPNRVQKSHHLADKGDKILGSKFVNKNTSTNTQ